MLQSVLIIFFFYNITYCKSKKTLCIFMLNIAFFFYHSLYIPIFAPTQTTTATPSNPKNCTRGVISGRKNKELAKMLST
ncbi:hypothetical protein, partial [Parabacteroides sp.]